MVYSLVDDVLDAMTWKGGHYGAFAIQQYDEIALR
jgi:hypothetical protein